MREIKFRCYVNKKMYEVDSIHFWDKSIDLSGAGIVSFDNAELMQFTRTKR